jgi:hypothetical protein
MDALNIITVIAIILFARLAMRLFVLYWKEEEEKEEDAD